MKTILAVSITGAVAIDNEYRNMILRKAKDNTALQLIGHQVPHQVDETPEMKQIMLASMNRFRDTNFDEPQVDPYIATRTCLRRLLERTRDRDTSDVDALMVKIGCPNNIRLAVSGKETEDFTYDKWRESCLQRMNDEEKEGHVTGHSACNPLTFQLMQAFRHQEDGDRPGMNFEKFMRYQDMFMSWSNNVQVASGWPNADRNIINENTNALIQPPQFSSPSVKEFLGQKEEDEGDKTVEKAPEKAGEHPEVTTKTIDDDKTQADPSAASALMTVTAAGAAILAMAF